MSGPSTKRENINAAPVPGLTPDITKLLQQFAGGQNPFQQWGQPSGLQQQGAGVWANYLAQPNAQQRTMDQLMPQWQNQAGDIRAFQNQLTGDYGKLMQQASGQGIIDAAQPVYQRNQQLGADILRQSGPRFASNTERLVQEQGQRGMQDFNLFAQQAMESGRNQQLSALAGLTQGQMGAFGQLGNLTGQQTGLAGGIDQANIGALTGFGNFANTMQGQQLGFQSNIFQGLLQGLLNAGLGPAVLTQDPGSRGQWIEALGKLLSAGISRPSSGGGT